MKKSRFKSCSKCFGNFQRFSTGFESRQVEQNSSVKDFACDLLHTFQNHFKLGSQEIMERKGNIKIGYFSI